MISTFTVSVTITNDCKVTASDINFASAPIVSAFSTVSNTINVTCTKGTPYTVGLSDGNSVSAGQRRMASGANYLSYEVYQGSSTVRWGSATGQRRASSGADILPGPGTGNTVQGFNYNARVLTGQTTPPAGTYTDILVLDVAF